MSFSTHANPRELIFKIHPDRNEDTEQNVDKAKNINLAYHILKGIDKVNLNVIQNSASI